MTVLVKWSGKLYDSLGIRDMTGPSGRQCLPISFLLVNRNITPAKDEIDGFDARFWDVGSHPTSRAIIHLDMDCFYAAIEVRDRPSLRGKPVGVGGARDRRGVLTTCNYEARAFGVRSAMPTFMALQRCPNLIVLPTRFDVYRREAAAVREILHRFTPLVEPLSLDEAYLDVSAHSGSPAALAEMIRDLIFQKTKLTSSAGIGPNKLIAKIASTMRKPNGQLEVMAAEVPQFMRDLPVREIWGIGEKTEKRLLELGVRTCGELQRFSRPELVDLFSKFGSELFELCRGIDDRPVEPDRPRKSLSTEETFSSDLETLEQCEEHMAELFQELMADLAQKENERRITKIFVKLKFADFTRTTAERAGLEPTLSAFRSLLAEAFARTGKKVRLIGVGVRFAETAPEEMQMPLFSDVPG
jgi:DNA polymerase-4